MPLAVTSAASAFSSAASFVQRRMIRRVVQADVFKVVIAGLAGVFEHRRLKDRHGDRAFDGGDASPA